MSGVAPLLCLLSCMAIALAQFPQRLNIPGAVLLQQQNKQPLFRQQQRAQAPPPTENYPVPLPIRVRKPIPNAIPVPIRPVIEESEELDQRSTPSSTLEEEVARLAFQNVVKYDENEQEAPLPRPVAFRPERPVPVLRENVREPAPRPQIRQFQQQEIQQSRPQVRQHAPPPPPPPRQTLRVPAPRPPPPQYLDDDEEKRNRNRKPPVQILRKYRTDNEDGSITWGYENEDGSFKEERIGADCVIKGKYGYVDPDGVRREYNYETGNKCDPREQLEEELPPGLEQELAARPRPPPPKKPYRLPVQ